MATSSGQFDSRRLSSRGDGQTNGSKGGGFLPESAARFLRRRGLEILGFSLLALGIAAALAVLSHDARDPSLNAVGSAVATNLLGQPGALVGDLLLQSLGLATSMPIVLVMIWGWRLMTHRPLSAPALRLAGLPLAIVLAAFALAIVPVPEFWQLRAGFGGFVGALALARAAPLVTAVPGGLPGLTALAGGLAAALYVWSLGVGWREWFAAVRHSGTALSATARAGLKGGLRGSKVLGDGIEATASAARRHLDGVTARVEPNLGRLGGDELTAVSTNDDADLRAPSRPLTVERRTDRTSETAKESKSAKPRKPAASEAKPAQRALDLAPLGDYRPPDLDVLAEQDIDTSQAPSQDTLQENARMLEAVLQDFGVRGEITKVRYGPVVTLYELEPAPGTKSARVIGLADDIARSMSAISVRVAVVPGRNAIGIELPNAHREMVFLREMLESGPFAKSGAKLPIALGKDIGGGPVVVDLARMPHLLIAGTTGSGKSVGVNTMILSLLYRLPPEQCRMIMIDPKMLELSIYDGIPHLLSPVVTDPKKAVVALKWTVREMEGRYRAMSKLGVRNIDGYNQRLAEARKKGEVLKRRVQTGFDADTGKPVFEDEPLDLNPLPYIVVVIDEMADLMLVAGKDIEGAVQRLAQMARAAGIHVIMATQRPSVDVITGTIKANFPTRISFQVTSKIDSRTILGEQGGEQLLGQGDMLYMAGGGRITRVHGPFVSDEEVEDVVRHLRAQGEPEYDDSITEDDDFGDPMSEVFGSSEGGGSGDELYDRAVAVVAREGKASTSFIQRHLKIGYNRAATLIERMESEGVVSSANHVGRREVLVGNHSE